MRVILLDSVNCRGGGGLIFSRGWVNLSLQVVKRVCTLCGLLHKAKSYDKYLVTCMAKKISSDTLQYEICSVISSLQQHI